MYWFAVIISLNVIYIKDKFLLWFWKDWVVSLIFSRVNGHPKGHLQTYGIVAGLVNCGLSFGSATGPIIAGGIMDLLDYSWTLTATSLLAAFMVSSVKINWLSQQIIDYTGNETRQFL